MKTWAIVALLLAAVLAEKALARPSDADGEDDDAGYQGDGEVSMAVPAAVPEIHSKPLILTPKPGDTIYLPCDVENGGAVNWLNNTHLLSIENRRLTFKNDPRIHLHANHTLEVRGVMSSDSANYTCKISESLYIVHLVTVFDGKGNGAGASAASVERLSFGLLLGAVAVLLARL